MAEVQRIWRIPARWGDPIEVSLVNAEAGDMVIIAQGGTEHPYALEDARGIAQAMLEAVEIAVALAAHTKPNSAS
jgi:hypothetical protein